MFFNYKKKAWRTTGYNKGKNANVRKLSQKLSNR